MEFRQARLEELDAVIAFSDSIFRPNQLSMSVSFPTLLGGQNVDHLFIAKDDDKIVSLIGLYPTNMRLSGCCIPLFFMGSVGTAPAYRGQHIVSKLMDVAFRHMEDHGAALLLVSGDMGIYRRQGCRALGTTYAITLDLNAANAGTESFSDGMVEEWSPGDISVLKALQENEIAYFERSAETFAELVKANSYLSCIHLDQRIWLRKKDGFADAYAVMGVEQKEGNRIGHYVEYAGSDEGVRQIVRETGNRLELDSLKLRVNNYRQTLAQAFIDDGGKLYTDTIPGTIRMMSFANLWEALQPYVKQQLGSTYDSLDCETYGGGCRFRLGDEIYTLDAKGATELVFNGPSLTGQSRLKQALSAIFPIPFDDPFNLNYA